jgi:hypothetical protein
MKKGAVLLFLLLCIGCSQKQKQPVVRIKLVNNGQSVMFKGLDYAVISEINRDSVADIWERLLPVYKMPADTDMKNYQPLQPGKYLLKDSAVVFTPDTPFVKTQHYFMRYYQFGNGITAEDFITGKKILGRTPYIDFAW